MRNKKPQTKQGNYKARQYPLITTITQRIGNYTNKVPQRATIRSYYLCNFPFFASKGAITRPLPGKIFLPCSLNTNLRGKSMSELQSTLVISNSKGLSEIIRDMRTSTHQTFRIEEKLIRKAHLTNIYVIGLLKLEIYWKYCGKEEKLLLRSNFSSLP